jgi:hypothetical protein
MLRVTWDQVCAWRLSRHRLQPRAGGKPPEVVADSCGLQAQLMPAAELALAARTEKPAKGALEPALWEERSLVKTWVMRGTLHVVAAEDLPLFAAAGRAKKLRRPPSYFTYHGVTPEELEAIERAVPEALGESGITREELAEAVARRARQPKLAEVLRSGWGALLKPSAFRGEICFGPNRGRNVTFVRPEAWLGSWRTLDPQEALRDVARRFLNAYGPATPEEFARWWGDEPAPAKRLFRELGDELAEVEVEGWKGWALGSSAPEIEAAKPENTATLLPAFDPYTIAFCRHPAVLPAEHTKLVSRAQGWISPAVLVNGRIAGTWEHEEQGGVVRVAATMFEQAVPWLKKQLEAEAGRLGALLGGKAELSIG